MDNRSQVVFCLVLRRPSSGLPLFYLDSSGPGTAVTLVAQATGLSPVTIRQGIAEMSDSADDNEAEGAPRIRRPGGGRKRLSESDHTLRKDLEELVDPATRGHPQSPLRWTCKSTRNLAEALANKGHKVSHQTVARLLQEMDYHLQVNRKTKEGASHPDRNAQFEGS
jgi:hypothetical protein